MDIKDFIKIDNERARSVFSESIDPKRDWYIVVFIFLCLLLFVVIFSICLYVGTNKGSLFSGENSDGTKTELVDTEQLEENVYSYESKADKFQNLRNITSIDPSL